MNINNFGIVLTQVYVIDGREYPGDCMRGGRPM